MPTLTATGGTFSLVGGSTGAGMLMAGALALAGGDAAFTRSYTVDIGVTGELRLDRMQATASYFDAQGRPTVQMQRFWEAHCKSIEDAFKALLANVQALQTAYNAAAQASAAASEAKAVVETVNEAVATVQTVVDDIQTGEFNFTRIKVGGEIFANDDGVLTLIP